MRCLVHVLHPRQINNFLCLSDDKDARNACSARRQTTRGRQVKTALPVPRAVQPGPQVSHQQLPADRTVLAC